MKADFLQGKLIERDIFFELPEEFKVPNVIQTYIENMCLWAK